jgi:hypothetical protein
MNELDLIRSFRADVAEPSAAATGRARRAWRPPPRRSRRPRPRAVALAAVLAAAGTAVALVLPADDAGRLGSPSPASAAQVLKRAAAAQTTPARPLRHGEFWYVRIRASWLTTTEVDGQPIGYNAPEIREDWIAIDGYRGFRSRSAGPVRFVGPRDRARWVAAGRPDLFTHDDSGRMFRHRPDAGSEAARKPFYDGSKQVSYRELLALPRDPGALHARLRAIADSCDCGQSLEQETFVIVGDLMRDTPIPGDLRAALLRAAAHIPGIERIDRVRDVAGRMGTGVAIDSQGTRSALIFDPRSYELLGESEFALEGAEFADAEPGELVSGSAVMESGIVSSPTQVR